MSNEKDGDNAEQSRVEILCNNAFIKDLKRLASNGRRQRFHLVSQLSKACNRDGNEDFTIFQQRNIRAKQTGSAI